MHCIKVRVNVNVFVFVLFCFVLFFFNAFSFTRPKAYTDRMLVPVWRNDMGEII